MSTPREKTVRVAELKARLSAYLRAARRGHPVTVCDRDTPVARLVPYEPEIDALSVRRSIRPFREVVLPTPLGRNVDSLSALLEERPFPTPLGTLVAIHLTTALLWRETRNESLVMATHDKALATAAQAVGLQVTGA